jgi:hypothetical protein
MQKLVLDDLWSLETYAKRRLTFRAQAIAHKQARTLALGEHVTLLFEDAITVRYQIQEMLRIERTFEEEGIRAELEAYNPLIPDGSNLKATMLIEYEDVDVRRIELAKLIGVEDRVWLRADGFENVFAIADEDMPRENADKTSAVHFLRFEFSAEMIAALKRGACLDGGVDHPAYRVSARVSTSLRDQLTGDFALLAA